MLRQGRDFIQEPADGEDVRLESQNNHWAGSGVRFFHGSVMGGGEETKKPFNSCNCLLEWQTSDRVGCVNFFLSAIYRWTGLF